ncbi:hypothetical protein T484DRAFT_3545714 [Baffinella frigidus]|nr:hypothetical protein T484DRAFT_3545714 [Cryptophyta sp. CCMP2293]
MSFASIASVALLCASLCAAFSSSLPPKSPKLPLFSLPHASRPLWAHHHRSSPLPAFALPAAPCRAGQRSREGRMQTLLFSCPRQHPCPARRPTQRARGAQCLGMAAGKGGDAQEGRAADVPEKELRAEEGALPWQPGGEDQIYAVLEGREIRGPVSVRFAAEDAEAGPSRGAHRWLSKPGGMAAVRHQRASPPGIAQAEGCTVPAALAKQVLVRVYAAGLDLPDVAPSRADIPGCEFAGTVVEVGEGCERLRVGDEVWGFCPSNRGGGLAEFVAAEEVLVALKPLDLDWAFAAAVPRAGIAALFAVAPWPLATAPRATREGTGDGGRWVTPTDRLLVLGADSPVGIYVSQLACALGASVTAVCDHRNQDLLASLGANTRDEMRVEGARGWQGEGLTQPPTSRRNAGRDDKEEQMDLRSINPSGSDRSGSGGTGSRSSGARGGGGASREGCAPLA